ncbi:MAG: thiamine transporter substrate binding subunit [Deltaproteobacteria bacterium ADurb.Bin510]|nr:MAG: thiamine transporter substrate binding subunit [Deltaproteobacteria bacterium ADurb.Bin510]
MLARRFVDFMLAKDFQQDIPLKMFVFPASREAEVPAVFRQHALKLEKPLTLDPALISARREQWLSAFSLTMLR